MTKRTWAKIGFAALALLLIVFAADIVLLVFASILPLVALLVAALLFGWLGLLLAAPATAAQMGLIQMVYVEDTLGERDGR